MEVKMYPAFNEVFATDELLGIFYPLCSVNNNLHFVSSNGLWMEEQYKTENNTFEYTIFEHKNGKYEFKGDIRLYKGYEFAKKIFCILENDFETNGNNYLNKKLQTEIYVEQIKKILPPQKTMEDIDLEYYLKTFYEFYINKLNYKLNRKFGEFDYLINGSAKPQGSPIIYNEKEYDDEGGGNIDEDIIKGYSYIGAAIGYEFFTDGNDSVLFYNENENKILSVNSY